MKNPLQPLLDLKLAETKRRYPNFPYPVTPKYSDKTANGLTKCIIDWLNLNGHQAERISSSGRYIDTRQIVTNVVSSKVIGSGQWVYGSGTKGTADISATINGRSVKIEVKIGKDRQSSYQKHYQAKIEQAGGIYIISKTFQDFYQWYLNFINSTEHGTPNL